MASEVLTNAWNILDGYLKQTYSEKALQVIYGELHEIAGERKEGEEVSPKGYSYEETQELLSSLNEKETIRKNKGVYYTPSDVVRFILINSVKMVCGRLNPGNVSFQELGDVPYKSFCLDKTVYDPTCGTGVFLLAALELKLDLLERYGREVSKEDIQKAAGSICGNDLNQDSITITKIRLFLCILHRYGAECVKGLSEVLEPCFECRDYVETKPETTKNYDVIIGNPPYVEDAKSDSVPGRRYGNIYANVLEHAALQPKPGGVLGFVIPLSYVSTPRMKKIRETLYEIVPEQYILSYSDRPDCLFTSVHQKLCILFGRKKKGARELFTGNYQYWYREERHGLFDRSEVVKNEYAEDGYIPKLGTKLDVAVYEKIAGFQTPIISLMEKEGEPVYVNMRAAFWIKAFLHRHTGAEYKVFRCESQKDANFCMCLLNSSLFWWYWICVSDCWHITRKELSGFRIPKIGDYREVNWLASALEERLEETKVYVGTRQTEYEYKHRDCVDVIGQIDDHINALYGLTEEEGTYIRKFAYRYRVSGGAKDECD